MVRIRFEEVLFNLYDNDITFETYVYDVLLDQELSEYIRSVYLAMVRYNQGFHASVTITLKPEAVEPIFIREDGRPFKPSSNPTLPNLYRLAIYQDGMSLEAILEQFGNVKGGLCSMIVGWHRLGWHPLQEALVRD